MRMKMLMMGAVAMLTVAAGAQTVTERPWMDNTLPEAERVELLLKAMTLQEKIDQLNQVLLGRNSNPNNIDVSVGGTHKVGVPGSYLTQLCDPEIHNAFQRVAVDSTRLGIPAIYGFDVIHGLKTTFPVPLAQGASFNPALTKAGCAVAAEESMNVGIHWTFSPMIDVAHDPRWGRIVEGYGEDPYLTSVFGVAAVQGYQGDDPKNTLKQRNKIAACLKHFVGYGASEAGRDYFASEISHRELFDVYLPPYKAAVDAGASTLMSAFNDLSGTPTSAHPFLETEVLRNRWKFDGFIVSDWGSVTQLINQGHARDNKHAAELALNAGTDMDMVDKVYVTHLQALVKEGRVTEKTIDESVRRILRIKFRCGLFENPYANNLPESERFFKPESLAVAKQSAIESFVLLENKNDILPLDAEKIKTIALIGPAADDGREMLGSWIGFGESKRTVTLKTALEKTYGEKIKINYVKGFDYKKPATDFSEVVKAAETADVVIACVGESQAWSGENASRGGLFLPGNQNEMMTALKKTGKPVVSLLFTGRPLEIETVKANSDALMVVWYPGTEAGSAMTDVLFGKESPSGKLTVTFPNHVGQVPIHYRRRPSSRKAPLGHYIDMPTTPSYTFGDGITYTTFKYSELTLEPKKVEKGTRVKASVKVTNTGKRPAKEAVLWFISDPVATITRPMKELKHFEKQPLNPGETKTFNFEFTAGDVLSYPDHDGKPIFEPGIIHMMVADQKVTFEIAENP